MTREWTEHDSDKLEHVVGDNATLRSKLPTIQS